MPNETEKAVTKEEYNICVKDLSERVYRFAYKFMRNDVDAQDVVQDAFEKLWKNLGKVEPGKARSWLFTTAHNAMINTIKKNKRTESTDDYSALEPMSANDARRYEMKEILDMCLEKLPSTQRSIILLRDIEGYSYQDIGDILDLSESQVKVYLFRARKRIKDYIKDIRLLS